jgi:DNA mismatch repair protein MutL
MTEEGVDQVPPIRKLTQDVAGRIAAGEVIERPVSVVKELIENALDASAIRIVCSLQDGGKRAIRIEDDGSGIPAGDLPLAVENFSTSKIADAGDILRVRTLGFRGEALASICAVSNLTIRSRTTDEEVGREMAWSGGSNVKDSPCVRNPGTDVEVRDLFFNLPARRKFLSSGASELRRITSIIQSFALAFPDVHFQLNDNARDIVSHPAASPAERVSAVFGADLSRQLKHFDKQSGHLHLHGFVSTPDVTRSNRSLQFLFVNRRYVKDRMLTHAVHQAYRSLIPADRFPLVALFLEVPADEIDVNVHPAKAEIRFRNEREVHRLISMTLRELLQGDTLSFQDRVESVYRSIFPERTEGRPPTVASQQHLTYGEHGRDRGEDDAAGDAGSAVLKEAPLSLLGEEGRSPIAPSGHLYWQLHQSYILIQIRGGMVVVDQHAAHERILFNRAKRSIGGDGATVQSLLFPATLDLTPEEYERFEELADLLPELGFEVEPFGTRSIIVRGIPAGVRNWSDGGLLQEILGEQRAGRGAVEDFLKTYACRAAVKAGTKLSVEEMEDLTDQLFATEFPFTCPHGRPTMLRVELTDLERRFNRTVSSEK